MQCEHTMTRSTLRTEIYYYSLLVSIKKFSSLLDWFPISRWRAFFLSLSRSQSCSFARSLFLFLSHIHTFFRSLYNSYILSLIFYFNRSVFFSLSFIFLLFVFRCPDVVTFYCPLFFFVPFNSSPAWTIPPFPLRPPSFVQRNEHTHLYYLYYLYVYIYIYFYIVIIHTQTKPFPIRLECSISLSLLLFTGSIFPFFSVRLLSSVCSVLLLFFSVCIYLYVCIVCI